MGSCNIARSGSIQRMGSPHIVIPDLGIDQRGIDLGVPQEALHLLHGHPVAQHSDTRTPVLYRKSIRALSRSERGISDFSERFFAERAGADQPHIQCLGGPRGAAGEQGARKWSEFM